MRSGQRGGSARCLERRGEGSQQQCEAQRQAHPDRAPALTVRAAHLRTGRLPGAPRCAFLGPYRRSASATHAARLRRAFCFLQLGERPRELLLAARLRRRRRRREVAEAGERGRGGHGERRRGFGRSLAAGRLAPDRRSRHRLTAVHARVVDVHEFIRVGGREPFAGGEEHVVSARARIEEHVDAAGFRTGDEPRRAVLVLEDLVRATGHAGDERIGRGEEQAAAVVADAAGLVKRRARPFAQARADERAAERFRAAGVARGAHEAACFGAVLEHLVIGHLRALAVFEDRLAVVVSGEGFGGHEREMRSGGGHVGLGGPRVAAPVEDVAAIVDPGPGPLVLDVHFFALFGRRQRGDECHRARAFGGFVPDVEVREAGLGGLPLVVLLCRENALRDEVHVRAVFAGAEDAEHVRAVRGRFGVGREIGQGAGFDVVAVEVVPGGFGPGVRFGSRVGLPGQRGFAREVHHRAVRRGAPQLRRARVALARLGFTVARPGPRGGGRDLDRGRPVEAIVELELARLRGFGPAAVGVGREQHARAVLGDRAFELAGLFADHPDRAAGARAVGGDHAVGEHPHGTNASARRFVEVFDLSFFTVRFHDHAAGRTFQAVVRLEEDAAEIAGGAGEHRHVLLFEARAAAAQGWFRRSAGGHERVVARAVAEEEVVDVRRGVRRELLQGHTNHRLREVGREGVGDAGQAVGRRLRRGRGQRRGVPSAGAPR